MTNRKKSVTRKKSGGRQKEPVLSTGSKVSSSKPRPPKSEKSVTDYLGEIEEHHKSRMKKLGSKEADLPPMRYEKEKSIFIPAYVDGDQNRSWQARCIYLLFTNAYWADTNYSFSNVGKKIDVSLFDNGRERGYTFRDRKTGKEISFSESRSSDSIVVYPFNWHDALNDPSDTAYRTQSKYFDYGKHYDVFEYILEFFDTEL